MFFAIIINLAGGRERERKRERERVIEDLFEDQGANE